MMKKKIVYGLPLFAMLLPAMVLLFIYNYIPLAGNLMAFERFNAVRGLFKSPWVGFDNFRYVLAMPDTLQVLWNTFYIAFLKVLAGIVIPIFFALLLNEIGNVHYKRFIQTIIYFPHFLSWVILAGILIDVLSPSAGVIGKAFTAIGLKPIFFLGDPKVFPYTLVLTESWKEFGFGTIVYLAALTGIDLNLYEAAMIDGANRWKQTIHVTIPGILPIVILMTILSMGNILNAGFDQVFNLYSPQVYKTGDILDTLVYRLGLVDAQYGVATAVGLFKSLVSFIMLAGSYALAYKYTDYRVF
ncbi:MAG: ABC transporter permease subunit [Treponema sp.]|jgi:putative aldouronate transport system permease protein|nr:ABC transporter permease subunit [Treponema sp.]